MKIRVRKKPIVVDAVQWTGDNVGEVAEFVNRVVNVRDSKLTVQTLEGPLNASVDDWIIRGIKGEYYPCKPDIFEDSYEVVEE